MMMMMKKGDTIETIYGNGRLEMYRELDQIYVIVLPFGMLYTTTTTTARKSAANSSGDDDGGGCTLQQQQQEQEQSDSQQEQPKETTTTTSDKSAVVMELNVAYESLETMRKLNLEVSCQELGLICDDPNRCSTCLLATDPERQRKQLMKQAAAERGPFPRIQKLTIVPSSTTTKGKNAYPCLSCGSPVCSKHSSVSFRREGITICLDCERLFTLDFVIDCLTINDPQERRKLIDKMIDVYDRSLILLRYSNQFMDNIIEQLQVTQVKENRIGLGSSTVGLMSGVMGLAAAATILTPAGPPLLIASLLFGGSATAVSTSTECMNYYSEPNKLADRIIALHGLLKSVLRVVSIFRDAMTQDHIRTDEFEHEENKNNNKVIKEENTKTDNTIPSKKSSRSSTTTSRKKKIKKKKVVEPTLDDAYKKHRAGVLAGMTVGRYSVAGIETGTQIVGAAETGTIAGRNARFFSRTGSNLMGSIRFAQMAGGTLSAAMVVLEARTMTTTIKSIRAGHPCIKADSLRTIRNDLEQHIPSTTQLDMECKGYLDAMIQRQQQDDDDDGGGALSEQDVTRILLRTLQQEQQKRKQQEEEEEQLAKQQQQQKKGGGGEENGDNPYSNDKTTSSSSSSSSTCTQDDDEEEGEELLDNDDDDDDDDKLDDDEDLRRASSSAGGSLDENDDDDVNETLEEQRQLPPQEEEEEETTMPATVSLSLRERIQRHKTCSPTTTATTTTTTINTTKSIKKTTTITMNEQDDDDDDDENNNDTTTDKINNKDSEYESSVPSSAAAVVTV